MKEFIELVMQQPSFAVLLLLGFVYAIKEGFELYKWWKDRADGYHKMQSKKENFEKKVCDIACTSERHTEALERLGEVLDNINSDLKGIQGDIDYLKDSHNKTLEYRKEREGKDSVRDRMNLGMARSMLIANYEKCVAKGVYTTDEKEVYHELYEAYKQAGGNGIMEDIRDRILELPDH